MSITGHISPIKKLISITQHISPLTVSNLHHQALGIIQGANLNPWTPPRPIRLLIKHKITKKAQKPSDQWRTQEFISGGGVQQI